MKKIDRHLLPIQNPGDQGFTLIELMIVIAIIGVLASIAVPMYLNLVAKSQEGNSKANLGAVRSALSIYYSDNEAAYPMDSGNLNSLTAGSKYLLFIPTVILPKTNLSQGHLGIATVINGALDDTGGFDYDNSGAGVITWGRVVINCTHQDLRGYVWSTY